MPTQIKRVKKFLVLFIVLAVLALSAFGGYVAYVYVRYPLRFKKEIQSSSVEFGVDADLVAGVIYAESGFSPNVVSRAGAIGLMQIMPQTGAFIAEKLGEKNFSPDQLFLPEINIRYGTFYLAYLKKKYTDSFTMLCAYNAGEGNITAWLAQKNYSTNQKSLIYSPFKETNNYAQKVMLARRKYAYRLRYKD